MAEIDKVLNLHKLWIIGDEGGKKANLYDANLSGADLREADLSRADLRGADLSRANLSGSDLREADLSRANLSGADMSGAYLSEADLSEANLYDANLIGADLREADLSRANLSGADLSGADLSRADLHGAKLYGADLHGANGVCVPMACPSHGAFIGWKKDGSGEKIIKLLIPEDAERSSATTGKCRCSKAIVLAVENINGTPCAENWADSGYDPHFRYTVGKMVYPKEPFCTNRWDECAPGIHFFVDRDAAVNY